MSNRVKTADNLGFTTLADSKFVLPLITTIEGNPSASTSEPFKVVDTGHGRVIEDFSGFRYSLSAKQKRGTESWRCSRKANGCKAYVVTLNDLIIQKKYVHTHEPPELM